MKQIARFAEMSCLATLHGPKAQKIGHFPLFKVEEKGNLAHCTNTKTASLEADRNYALGT